eukprot:950027-Rhodomonas_salina.1
MRGSAVRARRASGGCDGEAVLAADHEAFADAVRGVVHDLLVVDPVVRRDRLRLVQRLCHASVVVLQHPAVHHQLKLPRHHARNSLRAVHRHRHGPLRPGDHGLGVDGEVVACDRLGDVVDRDRGPTVLVARVGRRRAAVPQQHVAPVGVRVQRIARRDVRGEARDHLLAWVQRLPRVALVRHRPDRPLQLDVSAPGVHAHRLRHPGREHLPHLLDHRTAHHLERRPAVGRRARDVLAVR